MQILENFDFVTPVYLNALDDEWMDNWRQRHPVSKKMWNFAQPGDRIHAMRFVKKMKPARLRVNLLGTESHDELDFLTSVMNEQYTQKRDFILEGALNLSQWSFIPLQRLLQTYGIMQQITPCGSKQNSKTRIISNNSILMEKLKICLNGKGRVV